MINRVEPPPSSAETFGTASDDGSQDSFAESRSRDRNRRRRRKGGKKSPVRLENEVKRLLTPVVKVLLFGVFMSLLDVLYMFEKLEQTEAITDNAYETEASETDQKDPTVGREPILKLIRDAGIDYDPVNDAELIEEIPLWSEVVSLYGSEPVIYGLNEGNCERFQEHSEKGEHLIGTAGTFNTGTNLLSELLIANCMMPERIKKYGYRNRGIRWQVPWGKHSPVGNKLYRETHKTKKDKDIDANEIMPMVTIRDPLIWLKSMCRHNYTAHWDGFKEDHCPNFLMNDLGMSVRYDGFKRQYESVLHLWNDYYNEYKNADIPFLLVRFEDLVFHPVETVTQVCQCAGGKMSNKKFKYIVDSAKKGLAAHGAMKLRTGFVDAIVRYGSKDKRYKDHAKADLEYVRDHIDPGLMEVANYARIDPEWNKDQQSTI